MLNMEIRTVNKLINSNIDATTIEKNTGVDASSIRRIRRGERTVEKLSFEKGIALYNYQKQLEQENK
ncbi:XRE family transcriptional regulator [Staphylococcus felis]|uniref:XRE family transcriptional regulator n=1 Tax=Staphylococcus felis TaxID=46127 RepID=UPI0039675E36